ncbi:MAG TPA: MFS transporter [Thermomicrobiales bacterium]|nr:MFS transporter [Thermomicrobiales bacterium]
MASSRGIGFDRERWRILIWMCVLITANQFGFGAIVPVVPLFAQQFGVSQSAIGLTIAVYGLARFLVNVPASRVADAHGRRNALAVGGLITVIGTAASAMAPNYELFLIARFMAGAGAAFVLTGGQIVVADISTSANRGRVMAIYQGVFLVSVGAGAFPGGWLAEHISLPAPFWVAAGLAGIVSLLAWAFVPETRQYAHRSAARAGAAAPLSSREQLAAVMAVPGFVLISIVGFATVAARTGALFNVIPVFAEERIGLGADQIGIGLGMVSIIGLLFVYPSGLLVDRFGRKAIIVPSTLFSSLGMMLFGLATSFELYMVASVAWATASGISGATPAAYAADIAPPGMAAPAMGLFRAISDSGYVIGPLALGALADATSSVTALRVTAATLLVIGTLFALRAPESLKRDRGDVIEARSRRGVPNAPPPAR